MLAAATTIALAGRIMPFLGHQQQVAIVGSEVRVTASHGCALPPATVSGR
jgi:hypothetical protein